MALAHSRWPSMASFRGVRRESHRVIRSAVNTAMSQARTSGNMSLAMQFRKLSIILTERDRSLTFNKLLNISMDIANIDLYSERLLLSTLPRITTTHK
ncbi:MAG: hypothetical protein U9P07_04650 [Pseudomonadota bacterium]|nr:hypothetical protein [Pseudomonadota bacterium]